MKDRQFDSVLESIKQTLETISNQLTDAQQSTAHIHSSLLQLNRNDRLSKRCWRQSAR